MMKLSRVTFIWFLSIQIALWGDATSAFSLPNQSSRTNYQQVSNNPIQLSTAKQSSSTKSNASTAIASFLLGTMISLVGLQPLPAMATNNLLDPNEVQGIGAVTQSKLGLGVRGAVIGGAQIADSLDLQWERFSDKLRDEQKCDPRTNRRMFDNGTRKDGTKIGNPVLGALCTPEPLKNMDDAVVTVIAKLAEDAMLETITGSGESTSTTMNRSQLKQAQEKMTERVGPAFARAATSTSSNEQEQNQKRQMFNRDLYVQMRTYGETLTTAQSGNPKNGKFQQFEMSWGNKMLQEFAPHADRKDYSSPFPKPDPTDDQPYDEASLLDALGGVSVVLQKMQAAGIVGHWEISIPEDDYWNVVTIAIDDDTSIGGEILARESKLPLSGSPVVGLVKAAMGTAKISYKMDSFFIDPTTTKQELYNPSQLLVSLSDLGQ